MSDPELDDLFRESAAQSDPPDRSEEIWEKLQEKLDKPSRVREATGWSKRRGLIVLLLLLAGLLMWQMFRTDTGNSSRHSFTSGSQRERQYRPLQNQKQENPPPKVTAEASVSRTSLAPMLNNSPDPGKRNPHTMVEEAALPAAAGSLAVASHGEQAEMDAFKASLPVLDKLSPMLSGRGPAALAGRVGPLARTGSRLVPEQDSTGPVAKKNNIKPAGPAVPNTALKMPHWYFGLAAGPDWSSAAARGWRTGVGGGLILGYRFHSRWGVRTGIFLDKKIYDARPQDYDPKDNSWRGYNVTSINANCTVIEVPVNIDYEIWSHGNDHLLLSTGLSSYWMHEEEYTYNYKNTSGNPDQWTDEMYGKDHHLFSLLNFSAAYERSWQHISLGIEPYVQVPLEGIGYGRVKLYSGGIRFTLQYGLK